MDDKNIRIINEILNDAFWLSYILELKRRVKDYAQKEALSLFLIHFSAVFCEEVTIAGYGKPPDKAVTTAKEILELRHKSLKQSFKSTSKHAKRIVTEMGINLENYTFDIVLSMNNSKIFDINVRSWAYNNEEMRPQLECVVSSPNAWMDELLPGIYDAMLKLAEGIMDAQVNMISSFTIEKKSYSSYKLFSKSTLDTDNKLYILHRYGLIPSIRFISDLFENRIEFPFTHLHFDSKAFITKVKASVIEMFYYDFKNNGFTILEEAFERNETCIPDEFYATNRKARNNLHYNDYHYLTDEELSLLQKYQDTYLNNVISAFDRNLSLSFGTRYKIAFSLAKIKKWCTEN